MGVEQEERADVRIHLRRGQDVGEMKKKAPLIDVPERRIVNDGLSWIEDNREIDEVESEPLAQDE